MNLSEVLAAAAPSGYSPAQNEKQQLAHRVPPLHVQEILTAFNAGQLDALNAAQRLHRSPAQLYRLRHHWLNDKSAFTPKPFGGRPKVSLAPSGPRFPGRLSAP